MDASGPEQALPASSFGGLFAGILFMNDTHFGQRGRAFYGTHDEWFFDSGRIAGGVR
jgi:hypothetical protein